jgi:CDP-paratose 2-epimerase
VSRTVLVTGGAGFVGASLAVALAGRHPGWHVIALDNLRRRGSELNLPRLKAAEVEFVHGDVREPDDLAGLPRLDTVVECSAEPSALAGTDGAVDYLVRSNLFGAYACFERARRDGAHVIFLSTSRVYPYGALDALPFEETETRFELTGTRGVDEDFTLTGPRTLYGATKLAGELLGAEYAAAFDLPVTVDRCGVIAGPWQMGRVDQGVFTHWAIAHVLDRPLGYIGYGGLGKQVRDLLHVDDLIDLLDEQIGAPDRWAGATVNVGGGRGVSLSLREATDLCRELTGTEVPVTVTGHQRPGDVRVYLSDTSRLESMTDWRPRRDARTVLADTIEWVQAHRDLLP